MLVAGLFAALLLVHVATGPYRTLAAIHAAVANDDARSLARHVDFPAVRASLSDQLRDRRARRYGGGANERTLGLLALGAAGVAAGGAGGAPVTRIGLAAPLAARARL